jgi:hypothetical protein
MSKNNKKDFEISFGNFQIGRFDLSIQKRPFDTSSYEVFVTEQFSSIEHIDVNLKEDNRINLFLAFNGFEKEILPDELICRNIYIHCRKSNNY